MNSSKHRLTAYEVREYDRHRQLGELDVAIAKRERLKVLSEAEKPSRSVNRATVSSQVGKESVVVNRSAVNALINTQRKISSLEQNLGMSFEFYDPWGKGSGNPRRLSDGNVQRFSQIKQPGIVPSVKNRIAEPSHTEAFRDKNTGTSLILESKYGGGGDVVRTESGNLKTRYRASLRDNARGNVSVKQEVHAYNPFKGTSSNGSTESEYNPFGKPGGGAPIRTGRGKVASQRHNVDFARELDSSADVTRRKQVEEDYLLDLKRGIADQRKTRAQEQLERSAPVGELATVFRQGKVGFPKRDPETGALLNQHKGTSDVTKHKMGQRNSQSETNPVGEDRLHKLSSREYHDDLARLAEERHRQRQLERVKETEQEMLHTQSWTEMWGRPGGGAPNSKDNQFKKTKFELEKSETTHNGGLNVRAPYATYA